MEYLSEVLALACIFSFALFSGSFWSSGWWIRPADDDPWLSLLGNDLVLRGFLVRLQPVTLQISSRGTEKENRSKLANYCFLKCVISTNVFQTKVIKWNISQKFSRLLVISHSQFLKFILEFRKIDITCRWWSLVVIVGKWPRVAWLSCSFATGYTADLFSLDW